jgi:hypothetical protein
VNAPIPPDGAFECNLGDVIDAEIARARLELLVAEADLSLVLWISRLIDTALAAPVQINSPRGPVPNVRPNQKRGANP